MFALKNADYKTLLKRNITSMLAAKLTMISPLVSTILHYTEGNSCNQKVFLPGWNEAKGFGFKLKKKKKKGERIRQKS